MRFLAFLALISVTYADSSEHGVSPGKTPTTCPCGWANKDSGRIVNGEETLKNEYPFMAALISYSISFCGGAIITERHVLTAAHCTVPKKGRQIYVAVGRHNLNRLKEDTGDLIAITKTIEHKDYVALVQHNDIALAVLEKNINFNINVGRACLPNGPINLVGEKIRVIGWGRLAIDGSSSDILMKVDLDGISIEKCAKHYPIKMNPVRQFCTYTEGKDSCKGDSGGPLIHLDKDTNRYTLVGLVSYGKSCAKKFPGVNTDVAQHLDWIKTNIQDINSETCQKLN